MVYRRYNRYATKRYVHKAIAAEQEKKVIDRAFTASVTDDGQVFDLGQLRYIRVGDSLIQRTGDSVDVRSITFRGFVYYASPGTEADLLNTLVRVIVFQWFDDEFENFPIVADILQYYDTAQPNGSYNEVTPYSKVNAGKYTILYDKFYPLSFYGTSIKMVKFKITDIPQKTIQYSLTEGGPDFHITGGGIYMIVVSNVDETAYDPPRIDWTSRCVFTDS